MTDIADEMAEYDKDLGFPLLRPPRGSGLCEARPIGPARQQHERNLADDSGITDVMKAEAEQERQRLKELEK